MPLNAVGQCGGTQQEQDEPAGQEEQHLMGAGILHTGEQHHADQNFQPGHEGKARALVLEGREDAHCHQDEIEQAHTQGLQVDLSG